MAHHTLNRKYTILDSFYFTGLQYLAEELEQNNIPYVIGGGAAFQIRTAHILGGGVADIRGITGLDVLLRETGDVDLATTASEAQMVVVSNLLSQRLPFNITSLSGKRISLRKEDDVVFVNYQTEPSDFWWLPDHYSHIIDTAEEVTVRRKNSELRAKVPTLEYGIALKLLRLKMKDQTDIVNLLNACRHRNFSPHLEEVRSILKSAGKEECYDFFHEIEYDPQEKRPSPSLDDSVGLCLVGK
ncbi:MAG: hypothetical protein Q8R53_05510 [Nanoarchaeota archaeon]|nr:hypothetical protein [Nanoarchaeota archaeon]